MISLYGEYPLLQENNRQCELCMASHYRPEPWSPDLQNPVTTSHINFKDLISNSRRPFVCAPLIVSNRRARLLCSQRHQSWIQKEWVCVLFSCYLRFTIQRDSRGIFISRKPGTWHIWWQRNLFLGESCSTHVFDVSTVNAHHYRNEVLEAYVRLFWCLWPGLHVYCW